jgi:hypothetical protein
LRIKNRRRRRLQAGGEDVHEIIEQVFQGGGQSPHFHPDLVTGENMNG